MICNALMSFSPTSAPTRIHADSGNNQRGAINSMLAFPFVVVVTDAGFNRRDNVAVTFTVTKGGGLINGLTSVTANTDSDGRALAVLTLGAQAGIANSEVQATFSGNTGAAATFVATAVTPGNPAQTQITGVVLDNSGTPITGVTKIGRAHV